MPEPSFRLNFEDWNGPKVVNWTELSKFVPYLKIGGIRGSFTFERIIAEENILRILPVKTNKNGNLLIQFSLVREDTLNLKDSKKKNVVIFVDVRMPSKSKRSEIFIQDKVVKWNREKGSVKHSSSWKKYRIYKRIRDNASDFSMGIYWDPVRKGETLGMKNVLVYVW